MGTALVTVGGWDTRSERRDGGESERAVIRSRAVRLLEYLEAVRGLREQPVRDVAEYQDRRWWAGSFRLTRRACSPRRATSPG